MLQLLWSGWELLLCRAGLASLAALHESLARQALDTLSKLIMAYYDTCFCLDAALADADQTPVMRLCAPVLHTYSLPFHLCMHTHARHNTLHLLTCLQCAGDAEACLKLQQHASKLMGGLWGLQKHSKHGSLDNVHTAMLAGCAGYVSALAAA